MLLEYILTDKKKKKNYFSSKVHWEMLLLLMRNLSASTDRDIQELEF